MRYLKPISLLVAFSVITLLTIANTPSKSGAYNSKEIEYIDGTPETVVIEELSAKPTKVKHLDTKYYLVDGKFYVEIEEGYKNIQPPTGLEVKQLPSDFERIIRGSLIVYYSKGVFYRQLNKKSFKVVPSPKGVSINKLPKGSKQVIINNKQYWLYFDVIYEKGSTRSRIIYNTVGNLSKK